MPVDLHGLGAGAKRRRARAPSRASRATYAANGSPAPLLLSVRPMTKKKPAWFAVLPGRLPLARYSLEELRSAKAAHAFLTEEVEGPAAFVECLRSFRFLLFFGWPIYFSRNSPFTRKSADKGEWC